MIKYISIFFYLIKTLVADDYCIVLDINTETHVMMLNEQNKTPKIALISLKSTGHSRLRSEARSFIVKNLSQVKHVPIEKKDEADLRALIAKLIKDTEEDVKKLEGVIRPKVQIFSTKNDKVYSSTSDELYLSFKKLYERIAQ